VPPLRVADIGCGEGYLTVEASRWASRVIAIDRSPLVLKKARALATRRRVYGRPARRPPAASGGQPHQHRIDPFDHLLGDRCVGSPHRRGRSGARRRAGGRVLVLDLREHEEKWVKQRLMIDGSALTTNSWRSC
jgi:SAM-dependent methyltransferase